MVPDIAFWLMAITGVLLTGISKTGFAGGAGVVAVPLLALVVPVPIAATLMLPLLLLMDAKNLHYYWHARQWRQLKGILPAAVIGIGIGGTIIATLPTTALQSLLGVFCIVFALWQKLAPWLGRLPGSSWLWGSLSGFSSTLLHAGGPPISIYFIAQGLNKSAWQANAAIFFALMNSIKILPYALNQQWQWQLIQIDLILLPFAMLGVGLGYRIQQHLSEKAFMRSCRGLLLLSGLLLLAK